MIIGIDASRVRSGARTGTETYSRELIGHLISLYRTTGHQVRLYTRLPLAPSEFGLTDWPAHVRVRRLLSPRLWTHLALARELWRHPPDVLFIPAHVVPIFPPPLVPIVVTVHDLGYEHFPDAHPRGQRWYLRWSTRHSARRAQQVIVDSRATAHDLTTLYHIPMAKIRVVYPGLSRPPRPTAAEIRRVRKVYRLSAPYFLFIGTLHPRKNLLRLLDAFVRVQEVPFIDEGGYTRDPAHLVLAGKRGWLSGPILQRVREADVSARVHLLGYVPDENLGPLLAGAVALLFPSLYEGFGFPVLEAQALDVPVLTSRVSSLPEVAGDGALLVDPEDVEGMTQAIRRLLQDPGLRVLLSCRGRENVPRFSWKKTALQVGRVLERAARAGTP